MYRYFVVYVAAYQMENFAAHASDEKPQRPVIPAFSFNQHYPLCAQYGGSPPEGYDVQLKCKANVEGRYVYIHTSKKFPLTLCEVQVFGSPVSNNIPGKVLHDIDGLMQERRNSIAIALGTGVTSFLH